MGVTEAAKLSGKGRQTIYRAIEDGTLSAQKDARGRIIVDVSELERVYVKLKRPKLSRDAPGEALTDTPGPRLALLEDRVRQLEERVRDQRKELDVARDDRGRLLALVEAQSRALLGHREGLRLPREGLLGAVRRWLWGEKETNRASSDQ